MTLLLRYFEEHVCLSLQCWPCAALLSSCGLCSMLVGMFLMPTLIGTFSCHEGACHKRRCGTTLRSTVRSQRWLHHRSRPTTRMALSSTTKPSQGIRGHTGRAERSMTPTCRSSLLVTRTASWMCARRTARRQGAMLRRWQRRTTGRACCCGATRQRGRAPTRPWPCLRMCA